MLNNPELEHLVSLLAATVGVMGGGLLVSAVGYVQYNIENVLARYTRIERPDPVELQRRWTQLFDKSFHRFGEEVTQRFDYRGAVAGVLYQLTVGSAGMAVAISAFIIASWLLLGGMVASYYVAGYVPNVSGAIEFVAGLALTFGIAVTVSALERSVDTVQ